MLVYDFLSVLSSAKHDNFFKAIDKLQEFNKVYLFGYHQYLFRLFNCRYFIAMQQTNTRINMLCYMLVVLL